MYKYMYIYMGICYFFFLKGKIMIVIKYKTTCLNILFSLLITKVERN